MQSTPLRVTQRAPQSCQRCATKKMKCNKEIPCAACIKQGLEGQCHREPVLVTKTTRCRRKSTRSKKEKEKETETVDVKESPISISEAVDVKESPVSGEIKPQTATPSTSPGSCSYPALPVFQPPIYLPGNPCIPTTIPHELPRLPPTKFTSDASQSPSSNASSYSNRQQTPSTQDGSRAGTKSPKPVEAAANTQDLADLLKEMVIAPAEESTPSVSAAYFESRDIPGPLSSQQSRELLSIHTSRIIWMHNLFYIPLFEKQCEEYWAESFQNKSWSWIALYNSVICITLSHLTTEEQQRVGIVNGRMTTRWFYDEIMVSLERSDYQSKHCLESVQTLCLLVLVAHHYYNDSKRMTTLFATAVRIAQALDMNKIGSRNKPLDRPAAIEREVKLRVWCFICLQDWFGIGMVGGVNTPMIYPQNCNTPLPSNCPDDPNMDIRDGKFVNLPLDIPTKSSYPIIMFRVASIMQIFNEKTWRLDHSDSQYLMAVLSADGALHKVLKTMPAYLRPETNIEATYPHWVSCLRRAFTISVSHKFLVLHQSLFLNSFTDDLYTYTRETCFRHAQTILRTYLSNKDLVDESWTAPLHVATAYSVVACTVFDWTSTNQSSSSDNADRKRVRANIPDANPEELLHLTRERFATTSAKRGGSMIQKCIDLTAHLSSILQDRRKQALKEGKGKGDVRDIPSLVKGRVEKGKKPLAQEVHGFEANVGWGGEGATELVNFWYGSAQRAQELSGNTWLWDGNLDVDAFDPAVYRQHMN